MNNEPNQRVFRHRLNHMVHSIEQDIHSGKLKHGQFLPSELELTEIYQLSRYSVRQALDQLVELGYVEKIPRTGNKVLNPNFAPEQAVVRFGYYPSMEEQANLYALIDRFHELYPHIRVELIPIPFKFDDLNLMKHYIASGLIDVAMLNHQSYAELNETTDREQLLHSLEVPGGLYPFLMPAFKAKTAPKVLPFVFSPIILCYNKDHFEQYDLPEPDSSWGWTHLLHVAKQISKHKEHVGFYYHAPSDNRWPIFMLNHLLMTDLSMAHADESSDSLRQAIQMTKHLISEQGVASFLSQSDVEAEILFGQGKISMIMTTYFSLNFFKQADFAFDIAPLPSFDQRHTLNLVVGLAISANATHLDASSALVQFLISAEAQSIIRETTLSIPALKKSAETRNNSIPTSEAQLLKIPDRYHLYREIIPTFRLHSELGLTGNHFIQIRNELKLYWSEFHDLDTCTKNIQIMLQTIKKQLPESIS